MSSPNIPATLIKVFGWSTDFSTKPRRGRIVFTPTANIEGGDVMAIDTPIIRNFREDGYFEVSLLPTDDPDFAPPGWVYKVEEQYEGGDYKAPYFVPLLTSVGPQINIKDLAPVLTPVPTSPFVRTLNGQSGDVLMVPTVLPFTQKGNLAVAVGTFPLYNDSGLTLALKAARAAVVGAPAGASIIIDIKKNGTSIFAPANRPTIPAGQTNSGRVTTFNTPSAAQGDYFTVDIVQVGSSTPGSDLVVSLWLA